MHLMIDGEGSSCFLFIEDFDTDERKKEDESVGRPAWMIHVQQTTATWLKTLPKVYRIRIDFSRIDFTV